MAPDPQGSADPQDAAAGDRPTDLHGPAASDIIDVRLLEALRAEGCPVCVVRARSEKGILDTIINERVLDRGFRSDLERRQAFCRRHVAALVSTDRRETGGILGSSLLLGAILDRRIADLGTAVGSRGRDLRHRLKDARLRPPCLVCSQGATAVETALVRFAERSRDGAWAAVLAEAPFCLDDFLALWSNAGPERAFEPVARAQLARFGALSRRLEGFAHHSSHDRRHLLTDEERGAADEGTRALGGDPARGGDHRKGGR